MTDLQIHLIHADFLPITPAWNVRDVQSTFWRFYINSRDGAGVWTAGGLYPLPAGQIHLVPAYARFSCRNTQTIQHLYGHFDLLGVTPLLQRQLFPGPLSLPKTAHAKRLWKLFEACRTPQSCPVSMCLMHACILHALAEVIDDLQPADRDRLQASFAKPSPVRPALQVIEQRLPRPVQVPALAEACSLSPDHFARRFREIMGQTPAQYVLQRRITLAARQLLYGADSIDAIALGHGFANRFHFTRAFTREMGTTPAAYRRSQRV
jgi:AraC-like DNA-binding protein